MGGNQEGSQEGCGGEIGGDGEHRISDSRFARRGLKEENIITGDSVLLGTWNL